MNAEVYSPEEDLYTACFQGDAEKAQQLMNSGADVGFACSNGWTLLHAAAFNGHLDVAKIVAGAGAHPVLFSP